MTIEQTIQAITNLPVEERLRVAEALWDSFSESDLPPLSEDQRAELNRRMAEHDADPASALCLLYTSPSPRDRTRSRMPSSA